VKILCLGASFTGTFLASKFGDLNTIKFLTRRPSIVKKLGFAVANSAFVNEIDKPDLILDTIPPSIDEAGQLSLPYGKIVDRLMSSQTDVIYIHISSTSVYPSKFTSASEIDVPYFDEDSVADPDTKRGASRLKLEDKILKRYDNSRIIRAGGIYGPGRSLISRFMQGDFSRFNGNNKMVSRIHVQDLCRIILSFGTPKPGVNTSIVNGVDIMPSTNQGTFAYIEKLTGVTLPINMKTDTVLGRKITSKYAKTLLNNEYVFPTFREGFLDCIQNEE
tara:strand:- start:20313 stop:21140 length:828 start_codon:yes stop_codon:yes gene_type:complete